MIDALNVVFFPLMAILDGGVRFLVDPLILRTFRFYSLYPDQLPPNFYGVVSCVSRLNNLYGLHLDQQDINFMYSLCGNQRSGHYLKARDTMVQLISCLPDSNRNSAGEYIKVSGNWLASDLTCPTSPREIGRYHPPFYHYSYFCYLSLVKCYKFTWTLLFLFVYADTKCYKPNPSVIHV